ncbi:YceH family protein [Pseudomonas guineae]|uniref:YceH family protein n=1 Tax=Pseudomonas guineae TaxID=425504 RepID=UPI0030ED8C20
MSNESASEVVIVSLTVVEARVLGCLVEKQLTTPEAYPLTLNALVLACNQKTSREPVLNLTVGQVGQALRSLEGREMARLVMGSRADRWEHRADKALELVAAQVVLLGLLLLRGPQTLNELLTRSSRMHDFDDAEQVQHHLERLISRELACLLPRQSGQREDRYMHVLGDPADLQAALEAKASEPPRVTAGGQQDARLEALEARVVVLEERLAHLESALNA